MSDYWDQGKHVEEHQKRLKAKGYDIGYQDVDGKLGANTQRALDQERRDIAAQAASARRFSFSTGSSSESDVMGKGCASIVILFLIGSAIYWFVTVVLPILLMIAAGVVALAIVFKVFQFCVRTFGLSATLKGLAVVTVGPAMVVAYIANFVGDFEAVGGGPAGHVEPNTRSTPCGAIVSEGDNLTFADPARTADNLEGRWALIAVRGHRCWVPYNRLEYQRGIFMSLVNLAAGLRTTTDDHRAARTAALRALDQETAALQAVGQWSVLAARGRQLRGVNALVSPATALRIEEADAREVFAQQLEAFRNAPDYARGTLYARARALPFPTDKSALERAHDTWLEGRCTHLAGEAVRAALPLEQRVRLIVAASPACASRWPAPQNGASSTLAQAILAEAQGSTDERETWLTALLAATPTSPEVRAALETVRQTRLAEVTLAASERRPRVPERQLAARCAIDGAAGASDQTVALPRNVLRAIEQHVRRDAGTLLRAFEPRLRASLPLITAPFLNDNESLPAPLSSSPRRWRVGDVTLDHCGEYASLSLLQRRSRRTPPQQVGIAMCFHRGASRWFACPLRTEKT